VNPDVPAAVGVPAIVAPVSESPAGNDPAVIDHVYVPDPPFAASDCEYGAPTVPLASDAVEILSAAGLTAILSCFDTGALAPSLTCTVNPDVPAAVGVPEMFAPVSESPAGNDPAVIDHVYVPVPPFAVSD